MLEKSREVSADYEIYSLVWQFFPFSTGKDGDCCSLLWSYPRKRDGAGKKQVGLPFSVLYILIVLAFWVLTSEKWYIVLDPGANETLPGILGILLLNSSDLIWWQESTIGAAFFSQTLAVNDATVKFEIWDTAGQERYHSLAPMYYRGAAAAIIVYDITSAVRYLSL